MFFPTRGSASVCGLIVAGLLCLLNAAPGAGIVTDCTENAFRLALTNGGSVTFTGSCSLTLTQQIIITADTVIDTGGNSVSLSGGNSNRIFVVNSGVTLRLAGLTLANGRSTNGGALYINTNAIVSLTNCTLTANTAAGISGNHGFNGATNVSGIGQDAGWGEAGTDAQGGSIYNLGNLTIFQCVFSANNALGGTGGNGGKGGDGGFRGGKGGWGGGGGGARGGAIYNFGSFTASDCIFSNNVATGGAGGTNGAGGFGPTLGLPGSGGTGGIGSGAALFLQQTGAVVNCTIAFNQAQGGNSGNGGTAVNGTGIIGSRGADSLGAGVFCGGTLNLTNCTFFQNSVTGGNGGNGGNGDFTPGNGGAGGDAVGGSLCSTGTVMVVNTTFSHGSARGGTNGVAGTGNSNGANGVPGLNRGGNIARLAGTFALRNSILATNLSGGTGYGTITDAGNNLSADTSLVLGATSLTNTNPKLGSLANNGGFTLTMLPQSGSPAVNGGNDTNSPLSDQRGVSRPSGSHVDIGAVEAATLTVTTAPQNQTVAVGANAAFTINVSGEAPLTYQWTFGTNIITSATGATCTLTSVTLAQAGNYQVVVTNAFGAITNSAILKVLSSPSLSSVTGNSTNFSFSYATVSGLTYVVEFKNNLTDPAWTPIATNLGTGGLLNYLVNPAGVSNRFFHVLVR